MSASSPDQRPPKKARKNNEHPPARRAAHPVGQLQVPAARYALPLQSSPPAPGLFNRVFGNSPGGASSGSSPSIFGNGRSVSSASSSSSSSAGLFGLFSSRSNQRVAAPVARGACRGCPARCAGFHGDGSDPNNVCGWSACAHMAGAHYPLRQGALAVTNPEALDPEHSVQSKGDESKHDESKHDESKRDESKVDVADPKADWILSNLRSQLSLKADNSDTLPALARIYMFECVFSDAGFEGAYMMTSGMADFCLDSATEKHVQTFVEHTEVVDEAGKAVVNRDIVKHIKQHYDKAIKIESSPGVKNQVTPADKRLLPVDFAQLSFSPLDLLSHPLFGITTVDQSKMIYRVFNTEEAGLSYCFRFPDGKDIPRITVHLGSMELYHLSAFDVPKALHVAKTALRDMPFHTAPPDKGLFQPFSDIILRDRLAGVAMPIGCAVFEFITKELGEQHVLTVEAKTLKLVGKAELEAFTKGKPRPGEYIPESYFMKKRHAEAAVAAAAPAAQGVSKGVKFNVQDVPPSKKRLPKCGSDLAKRWKKEISGVKRTEAMSPAPPDTVLTFAQNNMLASAVHKAFYDHHPLVLTPDVVWTTIAQGVAFHVNQNAESLRHHFVEHKGKEIIEIVRPHFRKGSPRNNWPGVFPEFAQKIKERTKGNVHDVIVSDFTTTDDLSRICSQITLMDCVKSYFEYSMKMGCGIPYIEVKGTVADWEKIRARAAKLAQYDLSWWTDELLPVLDEFVKAAKGEQNAAFWQSICNRTGGSGRDVPITGWIQTLFPYLITPIRESRQPARSRKRKAPAGAGDDDIKMRRNEYLGAWRMTPPGAGVQPQRYGGPRVDRRFGRGINLEHIPSGVSSAPFTCKDGDTGATYSMGFYGGLTCLTQDKETGALEPRFGWAVLEFPK